MVEEPKVKKKRGRKPKPKTDADKPKIKKKRGRKPKPKTVEDLKPKVKKKKGRKPKIKNIETSPKDINKKTDNVILYLPIHSEQLDSEFVEDSYYKYNPDIPSSPKGYYSDYYDQYEKTNDIKNKKTNLDNKNDEVIDSNISVDPELETSKVDSQLFNEIDDKIHFKDMIKIMDKNKKYFKDTSKSIETKTNIMTQFIESNKRGEWPKKTSIYCYWCCQPFSCPPCGLPKKYISNTFYLYGCFCSPECAAAYNFNQYSSDEVWEYYSLLNLLYKDLYKEKIKLAPPRNSLDIFGGHMNIQEFRSYNNNYKKKIQEVMPPIYALIPQLEEKYIEKTKKKTFVPIDMEKVKRAKENLRLKRSKPVSKYKNTLESCMNLKYL